MVVTGGKLTLASLATRSRIMTAMLLTEMRENERVLCLELF